MGPLWTRRWLRLLTAGLVATVLSSTVPAAAHSGGPTTGGSPPGGVAGVPVPHLAWEPCGEGAPEGSECASARVPLDYRRPRGRTIDIALARLPALDPAHRIGSLFVNPGGPGVSGIEALGDPSVFPRKLRKRFDIVGFDPRGVGQSSPVACWSPGRYLREYALATGRTRPGGTGFSEALAQARRFEAACRRRSGELLPYIGTAYVARDLDLLRAAVGDQKLTFLGVSYGTYLGTVYAAMFPERVRALALDGAVDPLLLTRRPAEYARRQFVAADAALGRAFSWCVATPEACSFGNGNPTAAWRRLIARLDAAPIVTSREDGSTATTNATLLAFVVVTVLHDGAQVWPDLLAALEQLATTNDGPLVDFYPPEIFAFLSTSAAIECADTAAGYPDDLGRLEQSRARSVAGAPLLGAPIAYGPPGHHLANAPLCTLWSSPPVSRYAGSFRVRNAAPILVIGTTGDAATPYDGAVRLTGLLRRSRLLTFEAEGHTAFGRSRCVGRYMTSYLVDSTLPPHGAVCADEE